MLDIKKIREDFDGVKAAGERALLERYSRSLSSVE